MREGIVNAPARAFHDFENAIEGVLRSFIAPPEPDDVDDIIRRSVAQSRNGGA